MKPSNTDTQEVERAIESEQASDLAALQLAAGDGQGDTPGAPQAPEATGPSEQSKQLAVLVVGIARPLICYAVPSLRSAPDELWEPVPMGVAGVLDHYDLSQHIDNPWAGLALCCAPLAVFAATEAMKDKPKPKEPQQLDTFAAPMPEDVPGQKIVTFGAHAPAEA